MAKSAILWASGKGPQIDIRVDDEDTVWLTIRGDKGTKPLEIYAVQPAANQPKQLIAIARSAGLLGSQGDGRDDGLRRADPE